MTSFTERADEFIAAYAKKHDLGPIDECEVLGDRAVTYTFQSGVSVTVRFLADGSLSLKTYG